MYGVIVAEIVDSSLMAEGGKNACWIFTMMIAHADKDHCLRKDPRRFANSIDVTIDEFNAALEILEKPDPNSNISKENGQRIIPLKELDRFEGNRGWFIVNREHYINSLKSGSKDRMIKLRKKDKILQLINNLKGSDVTVTLRDESLSTYISISISILVVNYLIESKVNLDLWADYERYRCEIKHPLKTDQGRKAQINKLAGRTVKQQEEIIKFTTDGEYRKLIPPEDRFENNKFNSKKPNSQINLKDTKAIDKLAAELNVKPKPSEDYFQFGQRLIGIQRDRENEN